MSSNRPYAAGARRYGCAYVGERHGEHQGGRHFRSAAVGEMEVEGVPDHKEQAALEEPDGDREGEQEQHGGWTPQGLQCVYELVHQAPRARPCSLRQEPQPCLGSARGARRPVCNRHKHGERRREWHAYHCGEEGPRQARYVSETLRHRVQGHEDGNDRYEHYEGEGVHQALDEDGCERGSLAYALPLADVVAAHDLADAEGQQVVGHVSHDHYRVEPGDRDLPHVAHQHLPAGSPKQQGDLVEEDGGDDVPVVGSGKGVDEPVPVDGDEEQGQGCRPQAQPEPELLTELHPAFTGRPGRRMANELV